MVVQLPAQRDVRAITGRLVWCASVRSVSVSLSRAGVMCVCVCVCVCVWKICSTPAPHSSVQQQLTSTDARPAHPAAYTSKSTVDGAEVGAVGAAVGTVGALDDGTAVGAVEGTAVGAAVGVPCPPPPTMAAIMSSSTPLPCNAHHANTHPPVAQTVCER
jgi:hypothetical protein